MVSKNYALEFQGYQLESGISDWQMKSAIYCVYAGTYDKSTDTFAIRQLLYIGEAENVSSRIGLHQKKKLYGNGISVMVRNFASVRHQSVRPQTATELRQQ